MSRCTSGALPTSSSERVTDRPSSPEMLFWSTFYTGVGAFCFGVGAYLLIPELFDTD